TRIKKELESDNALTLKNLAVNGNDLMKSGITEGKKIGTTLNLLLEKVLDNPELNDKKTLLKIAVEGK
ncbi:MAG: polynucleotide adenylyltransferase, partial [Treponemataceae bacterium]|nr:polynucleotide adenylyltransferase [Treponemataceae bacterium]